MTTSVAFRNGCPKFSTPIASAIYLNNVGVSLMERCCYSEALETFYSALEICRATTAPSQAMIEHIVYRAYLRLSCVTDDDCDEDYLDNAAMPILFDRFGNNLSISQLREDRRWRGSNVTVSPFDRLRTDLRQLEYFLIYFQPNQKFGPTQTASILLATLLTNCGQSHLVAGQQQRRNVRENHAAIASLLFLQVNQALKNNGVPRKASPPKYPAHRGELLTAGKKGSWPEAVSTTSHHNTNFSRRQPRFKSNPAA